MSMWEKKRPHRKSPEKESFPEPFEVKRREAMMQEKRAEAKKNGGHDLCNSRDKRDQDRSSRFHRS